MNSTYRILFLTRKRVNSNGLASISVRISISGDKAEFSSLQFVKPEMWSQTGRAIGRTKEATTINDALDKIKIALDKHSKLFLKKTDMLQPINFETPI